MAGTESVQVDDSRRTTIRNRSAFAAGWKKIKKSKYLLLLFLPCLVYFILFKYMPMFGIVISFKNYNLYKGIWGSDWVGLKYYKMFFANPDFFVLLRNTFLLGLYKLIFGFPAPIVLALMLNEVKHAFFKRFVQTASYLPHFISNVVIASMVVMFLSPSGGLVNRLLGAFGTEPINFLVLPELFRSIYVASEIWQHIGWETIIYLAALTSIDSMLYEAAEMDGAGRFKKLLHVTLPGIAPAIVILFVLNVGKVLEIGFEKVFLLYTPATYETADILSTYVYRIGLLQGNFSYAAAIDLFTGVVSLIFICSANYLSRKLSETSLW
ncbi:ABC transporter permease [Paenibacillus allorhizosphaerae]|uniref:Multiple-sugar transport system permease YteP n=1 Tax=Paenibacillus allorhizosphaerae TaxID=2849866 RepID=A0ABN7TKL4_9BACL|nr:ABC transporter permease subunit [Paenibacillus allorhizosphaerae]CAG7644230.1 putative multiple-sugar transport system permease YteP [Paenibacillus allorhizosphaerae]